MKYPITLLATALALTACGGNSNETPTTSITPTTQSITPKNTDIPSSTAAQAKPATQSTQINNNPFSASIDFWQRKLQLPTSWLHNAT